jgi:acetate kinase
MLDPATHVLCINGGSSSIKFAVFDIRLSARRLTSGQIERVGTKGTRGFAESVDVLLKRIAEQVDVGKLAAVAHRVVHGGPTLDSHRRIDARVLDELRRLQCFDPQHLPGEIAIIEALSARIPGAPQFACFDTVFHRDLPRVARLLPIPRRFEARGVRRYGFHGLSYAWLMEELARTAGSAAARGRIVLAHLGNGASLAAVSGGKAMDTSMAFTPAAGIAMSTRSGDLDPGLVGYLADAEGMSAAQFAHLVNFESGLLGVSETSGDVRDLLQREATDVRAAEALAIFCYGVRKCIGAFAAALGGLDLLVFSGGIGEHQPPLRARMCTGLEFLGISLDSSANERNSDVISAPDARVTVRVMRTDEESMMARAVARLLKPSTDEGVRT